MSDLGNGFVVGEFGGGVAPELGVDDARVERDAGDPVAREARVKGESVQDVRGLALAVGLSAGGEVRRAVWGGFGR